MVAQKTIFSNDIEVNENTKKKLGTIKKQEMKDPVLERIKKFNRNLKYESYDKILSEME